MVLDTNLQTDVVSPIFVNYLDPNNTNSGIHWNSSRLIPTANGDEFRCPYDPYTGYPRSRSATYIMYCNPNGTISDPLERIAAYDDGSCQYTIIMRHFAACGILIPPIPTNTPTISNNNTSSKTLITSISLASLFGSIILIGTAIYCYKTQCKFDNKHYSVDDDDLINFHHNDDTNEREKPLLSENVSKSYLLQMTTPKLNIRRCC
jgi:hypothetical protein